MEVSLVLTVIGADRPGIVELISERVAAHDGNWLESRMSHLAGQFAGILRVGVPGSKADTLIEALRQLEEQGLRIVVEKSIGAERDGDSQLLSLHLVGNDREGIVRDISRVLAGMEVNVEELNTECGSAPMSGTVLFKASAKLRLPSSRSAEDLRQALEDLAHDVMVDITLDPAETRT